LSGQRRAATGTKDGQKCVWNRHKGGGVCNRTCTTFVPPKHSAAMFAGSHGSTRVSSNRNQRRDCRSLMKE
jgi:hypothetical protein